MRVEVAVENLREIKEIPDRNNVYYWLDFGTLLGAVPARENRRKLTKHILELSRVICSW